MHLTNIDTQILSSLKSAVNIKVKTNSVLKAVSPWTKLSGMYVIRFDSRSLEKKNVKSKSESNTEAYIINQDWYSDSIISTECNEY